MGEAGFFASPCPRPMAGSARTGQTVALVQERLGRHGYMAASIFNRVVGFGAMSLLTYGSAGAEARAAAAAGRGPVADRARPDRAAGRHRRRRHHARARVRVEGGWRITGRKTWISDAGGADYLLAAARSEPGSEGARGISHVPGAAAKRRASR